MYECKTLCLVFRVKRKLRVLENKYSDVLFGPKKNKVTCLGYHSWGISWRMYHLLLIVGLWAGWSGVRNFSSPRRPDRLWSPPSFLLNGYRRLFPEGKASGVKNA